MRYIVFPDDEASGRELGGKAGALKNMTGAGSMIPPWFVVTVEGFNASLDSRTASALKSAREPSELSNLIRSVTPCNDLRVEIETALERLKKGREGCLFAVRSSAADEDGTDASFAGQLESWLYVSPYEILDKIAAVWLSGFSDRILTYRHEKSFEGPPTPPAVLVQVMIDPDAAGVAFGADPVSGKRSTAVIGAIYGAGSALVSGEVDADTFHVDLKENIIKRNISQKRVQHRMSPGSHEGVAPVPVPEDLQNKPAVSDQQIKEIARLVRAAGIHFRRPQDIEWAITDNKLYLLQSRPITTLSEVADPEGEVVIWDNSNIAESYSGVTTPLTFSFARGAYEEVYREFCRFMRVPTKKINNNDVVFANLLGLIRGRIYYNLINWYRVLALLPGFTVNRSFMEQMMGVKEELPKDIVKQLSGATLIQRIEDGFGLLWSVFGLVENQRKISSKIKNFYRRLDTALAPPEVPLSEMRPDELAKYYRNLEGKLLKKWDAPLINDFLAMIFFGVLRKLVVKWCKDEDGTLQNDLMCGQGGIISTEPADRLNEMARKASIQQELMDVLTAGREEEAMNILEKFPDFKSDFDKYIDKFGDRCLEELKLESSTLHDEPGILLRSVGHLARRHSLNSAYEDKSVQASSNGNTNSSNKCSGKISDSDNVRKSAERKAFSSVADSFFKSKIFRWVLKNARDRVRDRENLRFERTRVFGRVRRIFVEIGCRFYELGLINEPRDIFYLESEEILGFIGGTATTLDLRALIDLRKGEFESFKLSPAPPDRVSTTGVVYQGNSFERVEESFLESGDKLSGIGCCPGIVRAKVQVITDPSGADIEQGRILVAERTDPGWILLFPAASGILVERGSLLSHAAIVSREMGIPSVVSIPDLTRKLKTGDIVEMDGKRGIVNIIERCSEE